MKFSSASFVLALVSIANAKDDPPASLRGQQAAAVGRLLSMPLIPHRNHPRSSEIEKYNNENNDDSSRRRRRKLDRGFKELKDSDNPKEYEEILAKEEVELFEMGADALYQGYGTHYVDLWIGTPPQRQTVIVDTGSSVTAFPCTGCKDCGQGYHTDEFFKNEDSSSFRAVTCGECLIGNCHEESCSVSVSYQEGSSWNAYEAVDMLYSGGPHTTPHAETTFPMNFGCQDRITGLFKTQLADGIMGMEMKEDSYWNQMFDKEVILEKRFSLCFSRASTSEKEGSAAGAMTMGGTDPRLHGTKMVFVNLSKDSGWFDVRIKKIYLRTNGGERVVSNNEDATILQVDIDENEINNGEVILDSGTTDTYLSSHIAGPFERVWKEVTGGSYSNVPCELSEEELAQLPTILFQVAPHASNDDSSAPGMVGGLDPTAPGDVLIAMPPSHYLEYDKKTKKHTSRLYFNEGHGGVLGANFMMGHEIFFDIDNTRIGVSESDCDYSVVRHEVDQESEE